MGQRDSHERITARGDGGTLRETEKVRRDKEGAMCPLLFQPRGVWSPQRLPTELPTTPGCSRECLDKGSGQEKLMRGRDGAGLQGPPWGLV